jgi:hypothetical protein
MWRVPKARESRRPRGGCPSPLGEGSEEGTLPLLRKFFVVFDLEMAYFGGFWGAKFSFKNSVPNALAACWTSLGLGILVGPSWPEPVGCWTPTSGQLSNTTDEWEPWAVLGGCNHAGPAPRIARGAWAMASQLVSDFDPLASVRPHLEFHYTLPLWNSE